MIVPVFVRAKGKPDKEILAYCILDDQSNTCFISNKLKNELGLTGYDTMLSLSTMYKNHSIISSKKVVGLEVMSYDRKTCIEVPTVFTRDHIPANRSQIPKPEVAQQWDHLKEVAAQMPPYQSQAEVAILLGNNVPRAIRPREIIAGNDDFLYAQRLALGWGIIGVVCRSSQTNVALSNRISTTCLSSYPLSLLPPKEEIKQGDPKLVFATKTRVH